MTLYRSKVGRILGGLVVLLVSASIAGQCSTYLLGHGRVFGLVEMFNLDRENNIPSYASTVLLLHASALFAIISILDGRAEPRNTANWRLLALIFVYLGFDEAFVVHEGLIVPVRALLGVEGPSILYFAWVVPGALAVLALAAYLAPFLFRLPEKTRSDLLLAALVYLSGAIGFELLGGAYVSSYGELNLTYSMITTIEEGLELAGVSYLIYALLGHIETLHGGIRVCIFSAPPESRTLRAHDG